MVLVWNTEPHSYCALTLTKIPPHVASQEWVCLRCSCVPNSVFCALLGIISVLLLPKAHFSGRLAFFILFKIVFLFLSMLIPGPGDPQPVQSFEFLL